jgi:hypothetical protein
VAAGGRLATITGDPPRPERGVAVTDVYVRADGARLAALVTALAEGPLSLHVAATLPLADAGRALQGVVAGHVAGASVLMLNEAGSRRQSTLLAASRRRSVSPADAVEGAVRLAATR